MVSLGVLASIVGLAVALAMDATAVAAARGVAAQRMRQRDALTIALLFGVAQALMPLAGFWLGDRFGKYVEAYEHWIAFALLAFVGGKMILESRKRQPDAAAADNPFAVGGLLVLAVATSIDAFAAGLTLPLLKAPPLLSVLIIGVVTAVLSFIGALGGRRAGARFGSRLEILGGVVLICLGLKVLLDGVVATRA